MDSPSLTESLSPNPPESEILVLLRQLSQTVTSSNDRLNSLQEEVTALKRSPPESVPSNLPKPKRPKNLNESEINAASNQSGNSNDINNSRDNLTDNNEIEIDENETESSNKSLEANQNCEERIGSSPAHNSHPNRGDNTDSDESEFKFTQVMEFHASSKIIKPTHLTKSCEMPKELQFLKDAGYSCQVNSNMISNNKSNSFNFLIPEDMTSLIKGLPSVQNILNEQQTMSSSRVSAYLSELIPQLDDMECAFIHQILFESIDFYGQVPPFLMKLNKPNNTILKSFSLAKNTLIQSLQLGFVLHINLRASKEPLMENLVRDTYFPMLNNHFTTLFLVIQEIKYTMLPTKLKNLNIHQNKPKTNNFWNLTQDQISAIKKASSFNSQKSFQFNNQRSRTFFRGSDRSGRGRGRAGTASSRGNTFRGRQQQKVNRGSKSDTK